MENTSYVNSPIGTVGIRDNGDAVTGLFFTRPQLLTPERDMSDLAALTGKQLDQYFRGTRQIFSIPIAPEGTVFQRQVWDILLTIPYGRTVTYGELAALAGRPRAARAVGGAVGANPIAVLIPCHRVLPASGFPGGYAYGPERKAFLLSLEKRA